MSDRVTTYEEELERNGKLVYRCRGYSMKPMLCQYRDLIILEPIPPGGCHRYDVVLYRRGEQYILHRILEEAINGYVICGDHNWKREYDITEDQIIGRLTSFVRNGKEIRIDNGWYRLYTHVWCDLFPLRAMILRSKARARQRITRMRTE